MWSFGLDGDNAWDEIVVTDQRTGAGPTARNMWHRFHSELRLSSRTTMRLDDHIRCTIGFRWEPKNPDGSGIDRRLSHIWGRPCVRKCDHLTASSIHHRTRSPPYYILPLKKLEQITVNRHRSTSTPGNNHYGSDSCANRRHWACWSDSCTPSRQAGHQIDIHLATPRHSEHSTSSHLQSASHGSAP